LTAFGPSATLSVAEPQSNQKWRVVANNAIPKDGDINSRGIEKVLQLLVEDGTLKPPLPRHDRYIDTSYLDEARRTL
jgi:hypothetical protein